MSNQSPLSKLYLAIQAHIKNNVPEIRFISQDLGQLEFYDDKPPVSYPCVLVDVGELLYEDASHNMQIASASVTLRLALASYSDVSNLAPAQVQNKALEFYDIENKLSSTLHNWQPANEFLGAMYRTATSTEKRDDNIRVRQITFSTSIQFNGDEIIPTPTPLQFLSTIQQ
jgi:hypothetical protein